MRRNGTYLRQYNNYQGANGKSFEVCDMQGNSDPKTDSMNFCDTYRPLSTKNYNSNSTYDNEMEIQVSADEDSPDSSSDDENECSAEIVKKMAVLFPMKSKI